MAVHRDMRVKVPKGCYVMRKKGTAYVYCYTAFFRNDEGKPRNKSMAVGVLCADDETMMHPNDNYLKHFGDTTSEEEQHTRKQNTFLSIGYTAAVDACMRENPLISMLEDHIGTDDADAIEILSAYLLAQEGSLSRIDLFFDRTLFFDNTVTSIDGNRLATRIANGDPEDLYGFWWSWVPGLRNDSHLIYDIAPMSAYEDLFEPYSRTEDMDLDWMGHTEIGLICSHGSETPVFIRHYDPIEIDRTNVTNLVEQARTFGLTQEIGIVSDSRYFSAHDFAFFAEQQDVTLTCVMPAGHEMGRAYIDAYGSDLVDEKNTLCFDGTYATIIEDQDVLGVSGRVVVGYSAREKAYLTTQLDNMVNQLEFRYLPTYEDFDEVVADPRHSDLFDFERTADGGFTFSRSEEKIEALKRRLGFFCIFTTDGKATAQELYDRICRLDDYSEQCLTIWKATEPARSYMFDRHNGGWRNTVLFISLFLRRWLETRLADLPVTGDVTLEHFISKLSDVMLYVDDEEIRLMRRITAEQRKILDLCGVAADDLAEKATDQLRNSRRYQLILKELAQTD